jgi:hypothetical protein
MSEVGSRRGMSEGDDPHPHICDASRIVSDKYSVIKFYFNKNKLNMIRCFMIYEWRRRD